MSTRNVALAIAPIVLCALAFAYVAYEDHRKNSIAVSRLAEQVEASHTTGGKYPASIAEWQSGDLRNVGYASDGHRFVLVAGSFGGTPKQGYEHWIHDDTPPAAKSNCSTPWTDTVFTDRGPMVSCTK